MNDELIAAFLEEAPDHIAQASDDLLALEHAPADRARLDSAFRAVHTLKGSAAIFGFTAMTDILHAAEDLLGALRGGMAVLDQETLSCLLAAVTWTERGLAEVQSAGAPSADRTGLAQRIRAAIGDGSANVEPQTDRPAPAPSAWIEPLTRLLSPGSVAASAVRYRPSVDCYFLGEDPLAIARGAPEILAFEVGLREPALAAADPYDPFACNLDIRLLSSASPDSIKAAFRFVADQVEIEPAATERSEPETGPSGDASARTVRIDAGRIDRLVALVDELVVANAALTELATSAAHGLAHERVVDGLGLRRAEIDRLVERLHDTVVGLRLIPLATTLRRLPRLVREASRALGKSVDFSIQDEGALADKSVVEALFEPLLHLVRNAVDHGIELPEERALGGKPGTGRIDLTVTRRDGALVVEIRDDGRGVDPARIRQVARQRGVMPATELDALSDAQVSELIFRPGFSTAAEVTPLSGRGVGMDAVRTATAALGGAISLTSEVGVGSAITLVVPINIMMARLLVVQGRGELYGVPMAQVVETARVAGDHITAIRAGRAIVLRGVAVPLVDLGELLGAPTPDWSEANHTALIVRGEDGPLAVRVDRLMSSMNTVMRPMRGLLQGMRGVVGAALLGDGGVMMVIDPVELTG